VPETTGLFDRPIHDALRGFPDLARCNIQVFYVHGSLRPNGK
jgi:hypothetical protein